MDPLGLVVPGQSVEEVAFSVARHNAYSDSARWVQRQKRSTTPGQSVGFADSGRVLVVNATEEKRAKGEVLGIDDELAITPDTNLEEFLAHPIVNGIKPTAEHRGKFVVLQKPLEPRDVGYGILLGLSIAKLNVNDEEDEYAEVSADAYELSTGSGGTARIIAKQGGTGSKWGLVLVGASTPTNYVATLSEELARGGTAEATIDGRTITVEGKWIPEDVKLSGEIGVFFNAPDGKWYPMVSDC
jgi:hypothetical protein